MDMQELLTKTVEELERLLAEAVRDEQELRRKLSMRSHTKTADSVKLRRSIARLQTVLATKRSA